MAVQRIESAVSSGWQARMGRATRFFADRKHGGADQAEQLARKAERQLRREHQPVPRGLQRNNASGINGLRPIWAPSEIGVPILRIQASWRRRGRAFSTCYSTEKHGLLGAIQLAIEAREKGLRESMGLTARQALARMGHLIKQGRDQS